MSTFASIDAEKRRVFVREAATRRGISEVVVEKDAWVSWTLRQLFHDREIEADLLFKGGTSLAKVHGLIHRFSEDIDLGVAPAALGFAEADLHAEPSKRRRSDALEKLQQRCGQHVRDVIRPRLEAAAVKALGPCADAAWTRIEATPANGTVLRFHYPSSAALGTHYIPRSIKLEFGSLTDQQPLQSQPITTILQQQLDAPFADLEANVRTMRANRTFWEKATILHDCAARPLDRPLPPRYARHYSDLAAMWNHAGPSLAADHELLAAVCRHKSLFFDSSWSDYAAARAGSLRLAPPGAREEELRVDYEAMRAMFFDEAMPFEQLLSALRAAEASINQR
ncbi:MAG: nucleotidyl transferase AbiEii/AbiGii toxin family protein [Planctomycetes bacterium]|nr:nucleotidyl transferase AbiEii/AbiGii toxin family protein [Planctomycetota bacterium]MCC7398561.1 nucleotidyl transferase AbiEii/AbiGii toxin family protein [Planctomycetota bacterium]